MSIELKYLAWTALLTAALWIPYIVCQVMTNGFLAGENYVDPKPRPVPLWGQRANRAQLNAVESFAPFAALVLIAHVAGKETAMTAFWTISFFWLRLLHAIVYMLGVPFIRTPVFTLGFVAVCGLAWSVLT
jgi:uncharacterized MAPEG superfamily protein